MKGKKKIIVISAIAAVVVIVAVILIVNFNRVFTVEGEATPVTMDLPAESQVLTSSIDLLKVEKLDWKEVLTLKGWVYRPGEKDRNRSLFLVLKSTASTRVFMIEKDTLRRADVANYFNLDGSFVSFGFAVHVPMYRLEDDSYRIGFVLKDEAGTDFTWSPKEVVIAGGNAILNTVRDAEKPKRRPNQAQVTLKNPTDKVKCGFERTEFMEGMLLVSGWAFLDGLSAENMKIYVLLKKGTDEAAFETRGSVRKDVTKVYKSTGLNVDNSGFAVKIPLGALEKGHYQVGVYIEKDQHCGLLYGKSVDIN